MKKRIISSLVALMLLALQFSGLCFTVSAAVKQDTVFTAAKSFLTEAARSQYNFETSNYMERTILNVSVDEKQTLAEKLKSYPAFRAAFSDYPCIGYVCFSDELEAFMNNLSLFQSLNEYHSFLNEHENCDFQYLNLSYAKMSEAQNTDLAVIAINELADFQYGGVDFTSAILTCFCISLVRLNDEWLVLSVESDSEIYEHYCNIGFDLQKSINGVLETDKYHSEHEEIPTDEEKTLREIPQASITSVNTSYNKYNAVNYALTYTVNNSSLNTPSIRNNLFYYGTNNCARFVSQCLWAGFDGSNDSNAISLQRAMDTTGSYEWHGGNTASSECLPWKYTGNAYDGGMKYYFEGVRNNSSESGIYCDVKTVSHSSQTLTNNSISTDDLLGAVLLVSYRKDTGSTTYRYHHAIIITKVTGSTRNKVYYSAYNGCAKNVLLSENYDADLDDTTKQIYVAVPRYIRDGSGLGQNHFYGDLMEPISYGSTIPVIGHAKSTVSSITMKVYKPSDITPSYTFTVSNSATITGSVTFNQSGVWQIVLSGGGLLSYTFTIRVLSY